MSARDLEDKYQLAFFTVWGAAMTGLWLVTYVVLWLLVLLGGMFLVASLRVLSGMHLRIEELSQNRRSALITGALVKDVALTSLQGDSIRLADLWRNRRLLLFLVSTNCIPCHNTLTAFSSVAQQNTYTELNTCVICAGSDRMVTHFVEVTGLPVNSTIASVDEKVLVEAFAIKGTPTLAVVDTDGQVLEVVVGEADAERIGSLIDRWSVARMPV